MSDDALTADPSSPEEDLASSDAVDELLRQLVDARFVLTDRDGAVTRWSGPAEELFGWPAAWMLGRPLVETLGLPDTLPPSGGQLETVVRRKDGHELEVAMALVPVRMSQSLEFNGFLEALEIATPRGDALSALGRSHRAVVDWIQTALEGNAHLEDEGLAAGTIVAFRPLNEPPHEPLPEHEADHERAWEDTAAELESELADTRRVLEEICAQVESLRGNLEHTSSARDDQARADRDREQREVQEAQSERGRLRRDLDEMRTTVESFRRDLAGTPQAQERLQAQVEQTREKVSTLETALSEAPGAEGVEEAASALRSELAETRERLERIEAERGEERTRLEAELAGTRDRLDELATAQSPDMQRLEAQLAETQGNLEALQQAVTEGQREGEEERRLGAEVSDLHARMSELVQGAGDQADLVEGLRNRIEQAQVEAVGEELGELRTLAGQVEASAEAAQQAQTAIERLTERAEEAAELARGHFVSAGNARELAASSSRETLASIEAEAARAQEAVARAAQGLAAELEQRASSIEEQVGAVAETAARALEASGAAKGHAGRAGKHAGDAESHVRRIAEAATAAERRATEAQQAAANAAQAAELARRSAAEAGSGAQAVRRAAAGPGYDRGYEVPAVLTPLDGRDPRAHINGPTQRPLFGRKRNDGPQRELREGFDDAGRPMATVELNGHFRELNRPFSDLVGYSEEEFQAALWPPVMDRANLPKHREQMNHLLAARISSADFDTGYVHAQGLLVPLTGTITLVEQDGNPDHFLLDVQAPA